MKVILQGLSLFIWLLVIPCGMGLAMLRPFHNRDRHPGLILVLGYGMEFVLFELVTLPIVLFGGPVNFPTVKWVYTILSVLLAGFGVWYFGKREQVKGRPVWYRLPGDIKIWILAALFLLFMLVMAVRMAFFNGDDAYYVVQSLITQQTGTMYIRSPYLGGSTPLDMRHAMAVFTMWVAYIASMSGIHTTILCHSILPLVLIPLTMLTYLQIGFRLLKDKLDLLPFFVLFMEVLQVMGNVSIYTSETFFLTRTWQGKSLAGSFLFPLVILGCLLIGDRQGDADGRSGRGDKKSGETNERSGAAGTTVILLADLMAGLFSSLAVLLCSILIVGNGCYLMISERRLKPMIRACLICIPGGLYMILYYAIAYLQAYL